MKVLTSRAKSDSGGSKCVVLATRASRKISTFVVQTTTDFEQVASGKNLTLVLQSDYPPPVSKAPVVLIRQYLQAHPHERLGDVADKFNTDIFTVARVAMRDICKARQKQPPDRAKNPGAL
jgi:hypothetical protein